MKRSTILAALAALAFAAPSLAQCPGGTCPRPTFAVPAQPTGVIYNAPVYVPQLGLAVAPAPVYAAPLPRTYQAAPSYRYVVPTVRYAAPIRTYGYASCPNGRCPQPR